MTRSFLLDTNVLLWALNNDRRLTGRLKKLLAAPSAPIHVSVVSAWEIAIKCRNGKLMLDLPVEDLLSEILSGTPWPVLPVMPAHILSLLDLPMHHRDPFDRMLIAQACAEKMTLATTDPEMRKYPVATLA